MKSILQFIAVILCGNLAAMAMPVEDSQYSDGQPDGKQSSSGAQAR